MQSSLSPTSQTIIDFLKNKLLSCRFQTCFKAGPNPENFAAGSSLEWARKELGAEYSYEISLSDEKIVKETEIRLFSTVLMDAVEILWRNGDKRAVFTPTPLDEYVWREDLTYDWTILEDLTISDEFTTTYVLNMTSGTWLSAGFEIVFCIV